MDIDDTELMHARGVYSTILSERKELVASINQICAAIMTAASKTLATVQGDDPDFASARNWTAGVQKNFPRLERMIDELETLEAQRAEWKAKAWKQ